MADTDTALVPPKPGFISRNRDTLLRTLVPICVVVCLVLLWQFIITVNSIPQYILPGPLAVANSLYNDWGTLSPALWVTTQITMQALALILIYAPTTQVALLICAFLVAFFPILSNMVQGLKSVDRNLLNLFDLYGASRWQTLLYLKLPSSLPYFMTGLRIGGGLALIAAVVAEFAAGSAGAGSGLAFRLLESQYRLNIPRLFAALILLSLLGVVIFAITSFISWFFLHRWHESSLKREN
jgi:NitT/TauT family transport system permease protein